MNEPTVVAQTTIDYDAAGINGYECQRIGVEFEQMFRIDKLLAEMTPADWNRILEAFRDAECGDAKILMEVEVRKSGLKICDGIWHSFEVVGFNDEQLWGVYRKFRTDDDGTMRVMYAQNTMAVRDNLPWKFVGIVEPFEFVVLPRPLLGYDLYKLF